MKRVSFEDDDTHAYEESSEEETTDTEPFTVFLGTLTLRKDQQAKAKSEASIFRLLIT